MKANKILEAVMTQDSLIGPLAVMSVTTVGIVWAFLAGGVAFYRRDIQSTLVYIALGAVAAMCHGIRYLLAGLSPQSLFMGAIGAVLLFMQAVLGAVQLTMLLNLLQGGPTWRSEAITEFTLLLLIFTVSFLVAVGLIHWSFYAVFGSMLIVLSVLIVLTSLGRLRYRLGTAEAGRGLLMFAVSLLLNIGLGFFLLFVL
jgi:hypothetical protein